MADYYQDRAAAVARAVLGAVVQHLSDDTALRSYVVGLLRDEIHDIEHQIANDRREDHARTNAASRRPGRH